MNDTARLTLVRPIRAGEQLIAEVTIRRPKVRDLRAIDKAREPGASELSQAIAMAATLCDLPPEAMEEMDAADFAAISEVLGGFLPRGPA
jgi:hypothetical protein